MINRNWRRAISFLLYHYKLLLKLHTIRRSVDTETQRRGQLFKQRVGSPTLLVKHFKSSINQRHSDWTNRFNNDLEDDFT